MTHKYTCPDLSCGTRAPCAHYIRTRPGQAGVCRMPTRFLCTEAVKRYLPSISYSSLSSFIRCHRCFYFSKIKGIRMRAECLPQPMKLGIVWDAFMQHKHDESDVSQRVTALQLEPSDMARLNALIRAYTDLEISVNTENLLSCQYKINMPMSSSQITGYVDRAYVSHIVETKLSARPDFYTHKENIEYQAATYLMTNDNWQYMDVEVVRAPGQRTGFGKKSDEDPQAFEDRIYSDIIGRPAYYFLGWNRKTKTFGVRFWRSEFDLDETYRTYVHVLRELKEAIKHESWYRNKLACHVPAPCQYLPICKTGVVSDRLFEYQPKPDEQQKGGDKNEDIAKE